MSEQVIAVEGLSKCYQIGAKERHGRTFRETMSDLVRKPFARLRNGENEEGAETFWALKDVSFEVKRGEVVGIIGRNGAGKSTLLKILSRITEPTNGRVRLRGRVASLLEVGTGFHPELTGRENIYLNGAMLGMKRAEIMRKFDEIVAFAEVEKFLDTPVKRYSSGMYVRLAFAVAAHLEPEILIVDEVLAVGDAEFQKKCLGKMQEVSRGEGRTVLFVSHNLQTISALCDCAVLMRSGKVAATGTAPRMVNQYLTRLGQFASVSLAERKDRGGTGKIRLIDLRLESPIDRKGVLASCGPASIYFQCDKDIGDASCAFTIYDLCGYPVAHFKSGAIRLIDSHAGSRPDGFQWRTDLLPLAPGRYRVNVSLHSGDVVHDHIEGAAELEVIALLGERGRVADSGGLGSLMIPHTWEQVNDGLPRKGESL